MARLPTELHTIVTCYATAATLRTLCLTSASFRAAATPKLYRSVDCNLHHQVTQFFAAILSNPWLGSYVISLSLSLTNKESITAFTPALRQMPNIQQLCCWQIAAACLADATCADIVAGLRKLEAIDWRRDEHFDLGQLFARLRPLKRIALYCHGEEFPVFEDLVLRSCSVLEQLALFEYPLDELVRRLPLGTVFQKLNQIRVYSRFSLRPISTVTFPALKNLYATEIEDIGLLQQADVLPALRKLSVQLNYSVPGHSRSSPDSGLQRRQLQYVYLSVQYLSSGRMMGARGLSDDVKDRDLDLFCNYVSVLGLRELRSLVLRVYSKWQLRVVCEAVRRLGPISLCYLRICWLERRTAVMEILRGLLEDGLLPRLQALSVTVHADSSPEGTTPAQALLAAIATRLPRLCAIQVRTSDGQSAYFSVWARTDFGADGVWSQWLHTNDRERCAKMPWPASLFSLEDQDIIGALEEQ